MPETVIDHFDKDAICLRLLTDTECVDRCIVELEVNLRDRPICKRPCHVKLLRTCRWRLEWNLTEQGWILILVGGDQMDPGIFQGAVGPIPDSFVGNFLTAQTRSGNLLVILYGTIEQTGQPVVVEVPIPVEGFSIQGFRGSVAQEKVVDSWRCN